ncbi:MAG: ABC transporter ATP-binding protein, partial [Clostridium paraputrificum]
MAKNSTKQDEKVTRRSKKDIIIRLSKYLKPYKKQSIIVILLMFFVMLCSVINPYLLKVAIDDKVVNKDVSGLVLIGVVLVVLNLIAWVFSRIRWNMISEITNNILINIRHELYSHIQTLSFEFFDSRPVGKILARVVGDVNALKNLFNQSIQSLIPELLSFICVSVVMLFLNVKLTLACMALLPLLGVAMVGIDIISRRRWEVYRNKRSNLNAFTHEDFSGIKVVEGFAREEHTSNKFKELVHQVVEAFIKAVRINDFFWPLSELAWGIGTVVVFAVGYNIIINGEIEIGTLLAFSMYVGMFWRPIMNISSFYNTFVTNLSAADRIFDILDIKGNIKNKDNAKVVEDIKGHVEFKKVYFAYEDGINVLKDVSFKVESGERIALVGSTGAGKSTIVSLLSRFYDVSSGEILVDGKNLKDLDIESFRSHMGIM